VRIGLMNRTMAEVKEGLNEGDHVAIETPDTSSGGADSGGGGRGMRGMPRL
jgi:hypothetical protein